MAAAFTGRINVDGYLARCHTRRVYTGPPSSPNLQTGEVLTVWTPPVTHEGLVVGVDQAGRPMIASASGRRGLVVVEDLAEFANGKAVTRRGYYGQLPPDVVRRRAMSQVGQEYSVWNANCEQFTRRCHGVEAQSPQLRAAFASVALLSLGAVSILARVFSR